MTAADYATIASTMLWPLTAILSAIIVTRRLATDVRPIFINIVNGVAKGAQSNAMAYAIAFGFGLSASLSAFWDVFHTLDATSFSVMTWHQYAALWTKVLNPFVVAVLAYVVKNEFKGGALASSTAEHSPPTVSIPPFPAPTTDQPIK